MVYLLLWLSSSGYNQKHTKQIWLTYQLLTLISLHAMWIRIVSGVNTLRPRQRSHHFADIYKLISFYEICWILIQISLKYIADGPIINNPALV